MQHKIGTIVEGKVTGITKFGAFVELDGGEVGMVHISEISTTYVNDISEHLKELQQVKVKVLNVGEDGKISLSIKKAMPQSEAPRREFKPSGNSPRPQQQGSGFNRPRPSGGGYSKPSQAQPAKPATFDDMLTKFLQTSDEKHSDSRREKSSRRSSPKKNRDYD